MNYLLSLFLLVVTTGILPAQESSRSLSLDEYERAKTFRVANLDEDTYLKIDNAYILDRGNMPLPYFITGDDGLRKRIDLYKLMDKATRGRLGTVIYYTNERGKLYTAVLPTPNASPQVWAQYFEDIHATNKEEENYVLKLAYVISKELSQAYSGPGRPQSQLEGAAYGTEICFPGNMLVKLANGSTKPLQTVQSGESIWAIGGRSTRPLLTRVTQLTSHRAEPYALIRLMAINRSMFHSDAQGNYVQLRVEELVATPNHPIRTTRGNVPLSEVRLGDKIWVAENDYSKLCTVFWLYEFAGPPQQVYSLSVEGADNQPVLNEIAVRQKE